LAKREIVRAIKPNPQFIPGTLAFSPDRKTVAAGGAVVKWWNVSDGKELQSRKTERNYAGRTPIAFSPDRGSVAAGVEQPLVKLWDVATGKEERTLTADSTIGDLAYSPDGSLLAAQVGGGKVTLWDAKTYVKGATIPIRGAHVAFAPDSLHLLVHQGERVVILRLRASPIATASPPK
jgi:WD40 repeat protein